MQKNRLMKSCIRKETRKKEVKNNLKNDIMFIVY